jgi:hypothetical protein
MNEAFGQVSLERRDNDESAKTSEQEQPQVEYWTTAAEWPKKLRAQPVFSLLRPLTEP